ncbi:protein kinase domain-containing protein [Citrus sinensis]|nr:protein kinase domain-containing protein [Citrus sinensis]
MEIFHCLYLNLFIWLVFVPAVSANDPYSEALLSLKSELVDDFNSLHDWFVPPGVNPAGKIYACSWSGVKCNKNNTIVVGINLSMKGLSGALPGKPLSIFFNELVDLNLSHNSFSGQFPVEIFNLTSLISLDISRNNFSGHFPGGIQSLRNLLVLDAFSNSFSGSVPAEISQLEHLKVLNLAGSYFSGPIPSQFGSFKSLEFLHLAGNLLNDQIPAELGMLKTVTHMEIGYNFYQGNIPWQLGNMSEVQYLDIAGANLSGSIPKELSNLTKLESLFLFRNQLAGQVPWEFSRVTTLKSLDLSDNRLSGPIPESFADLKNLRLLSLMYNEMSGTVPESLVQLPSLEILFIWNNYFSGSLPENLGRNSKLRWVDVSTNNFNGSIPPDICSGGVLFKLILFSNNFTGSLSPSLSNCSSLVRLRLEDNSFSGIVTFIAAALLGIFFFRRGGKGHWKMISFLGLPQFTANDVLRSFNSTECEEAARPQSAAGCKAVLPTGITVSVKKIEWGATRIKIVSEFITRIGTVRHKNLIRLLGFCYNRHQAYLLYDYLPNGNLSEKIRTKRDWAAKYKIVLGVARGLCFLHHDCYPAIPHGDLKASNIVFDENMEPHLAEFGFKYLTQLADGSFPAKIAWTESGEFYNAMKEEMYMDVYGFGEIILEILTNGRLTNAGSSLQNKPIDGLLGEMYNENEVGSSSSLQDEIKLVLDVALLCTRSTPSDRPSMEEALKLLSGLKPHGK